MTLLCSLLIALNVGGLVHSRSTYASNDDVLVRTKLGTLRGFRQNFEGETLSVFLGVPFAKPPIGDLRFALPEMIDPWHGEFEARKAAKSCYITPDMQFPQFPGAEMWNPPNVISEDCLALNIWVPKRHNGNVLVWVYGGGFISGSPSLDLYDGRVLAARQKVIVVNINYRLGPFGFLYFGAKSSIPGNMGLMDQQLALKWIYENIGAFGGDPHKVTLFGESAGSAAITAHLFAPGSNHYYRRIIAQSGTVINTWSTKPTSTMFETSVLLARQLNCTNGLQMPIDVDAASQCLRKKSTHLIQNAADVVASSIILPMTFSFAPIEEDDNFFQGNVFKKIRGRDFKKDISVIIGNMKDEGTYWLPYYLQNPKMGFQFNHTISAEDTMNRALIQRSQYIRSIEAFLPYFGNSQLVRHALLSAYEEGSGSKDPRERLRDGVARFVGEFFFTCSSVEFADYLADNIYGSVYMYYLTKRSSANPWPKWMGAMHGYEIEYAFGMPFRLPHLYAHSQLASEQKFSAMIMKYWTDFAETGVPVSFWPKYNRVTRKSLVLDDVLTESNHRIEMDVHGKNCRLLSEATAFITQDCNTRTDGYDMSGVESQSFRKTVVLLIVWWLQRVR
ncbi:hypothetical protein AB6A40_005142 [Gnathostoma spinigerum]|uniref:Carboxylic ester hydrolase n=1 Tax=Gnathostoma spinigerum TaxID=75299 RepID=A0ABD6EN79_9BILA